MYRLSIIVPVLGNNEQFEDTLVSVLQNRPADSEVLVVHSGSYADPYELRDEVQFVELANGASLVQMLNAGCQEAAGEIVHVLLPGVLAEQGWSEAAVEWFDDRDVAAVAPLILDANDPESIVTAGLRYSIGGRRITHGARRSMSRAKRVFRSKIHGPALQAAFYRKTVLLKIGGFDELCGDAWADIDVGLSLKCLEYRCILEPESAVFANTAVTENVVGYRAGRGAERTFWRHISSNGWLRSLVFHPFAVLGTVLGSWNRTAGYTHLLGRMITAFGFLGHAAHTQRLRELADASGEPQHDHLSEQASSISTGAHEKGPLEFRRAA